MPASLPTTARIRCLIPVVFYSEELTRVLGPSSAVPVSAGTGSWLLAARGLGWGWAGSGIDKQLVVAALPLLYGHTQVVGFPARLATQVMLQSQLARPPASLTTQLMRAHRYLSAQIPSSACKNPDNRHLMLQAQIYRPRASLAT